MQGIAEKAFVLSSRFPPIKVRSPSAAYASRFGASPERYASFSLAVALFPAFIALFLPLPAPEFALSAFLLAYAASASLLLLLPKLAFNRIKTEVESELPLFLRTLGMLLELKIPFHRALERLSAEDFAISPYLRKSVGEIKRGATVPSALASMAAELESPQVKRAVSQLLSAYESGGGARAIMKISDDLFLLQQHRAKEFSSKQAIFSLLFIAVSTILPAVFLIFSALGGPVFSSTPDPAGFSLAFLLGFPLVSACILLASSLFSPAHPMEEKQGSSRFLLPAALALFFTLVSLAAPGPPIVMFLLFATLLLSAAWFYPQYKRDRHREAVEAGLPDALLSASASSSAGRLESLFSSMQKASSQELSAELSLSLKQLHANIKPARVLEDFWRRNGSLVLRRVSVFLSHLLDSGADAQSYVSMMAEDLFRLFELRRERQNALAMQKYTLIFGALILPLVLGNSLSLISGISGTVGGGEPILQAAHTVIPAYLVIYAFLAAAFIAGAESRNSSAPVYFASLSIASTILFYLFSGTVSP